MKDDTPTGSTVFPIGVVLSLMFSLMCGVLNIGVLFLFGLPLVPVLVGLTLVWISRERTKNKILVSMLTVPAIATGFLLYFWILPRAEPETFLLPNDYRGPFVVLLIEGCGSTIPYENGRRIYNIPPSGVLSYSGKTTEGVIDRRFALSNSDGTFTQLPEFDHSAFDEEIRSFKWRFSREELTKETLGVFWGYMTVTDSSFVISNYREMEKLTSSERENVSRQLQRKIDAELQSKNCRR